MLSGGRFAEGTSPTTIGGGTSTLDFGWGLRALMRSSMTLPPPVVVGGGGVDGWDALTVTEPTCDSLDVVFSRVADAPSGPGGALVPLLALIPPRPSTCRVAGGRRAGDGAVRSAAMASTEADSELPVIVQAASDG